MNNFFRKHHRAVFYSSWILLGIIQAYFTELDDDEAFYWLYSKFPSWGYFDHPPMVGLIIKAGYFFFKNELGVRLVSVFLSGATIFVIEKLVNPKKPFLFYTVVLSVGVFQVSGFMAAPDIPLIFFTAVFFWCYKKFAANQSLITALLVGLSAALLLYSKYHGILILFFVLLSDLKLLKHYYIYLAGIVALLCFAPHLWWQYQHDWPSIQHHLYERYARAYSFSFTLEYLLGQILIVGPVAGFILLPACFNYKPQNETERAFRFSIIGIYLFFLLSSFKGRVEANWTDAVFIPLIALSYLFLEDRPKWSAVLLKTLPFTLILVLFVRIMLIADLHLVSPVEKRFHSWKDWPAKMKEKTNGLPVVFKNSHQRAAKYWFYSGQPAYSLNSYRERRSNFDYWPVEDSLLGKPVYIFDVDEQPQTSQYLKTPIGFIDYQYDPFFYSFAKIKVIPSASKLTIKEGEPLSVHCKFQIPGNYSAFIQAHPEITDTVRIAFFNKTEWAKDIILPLSVSEMSQKKEADITVDPLLPKGEYHFLFAIQAGKNIPTHNSEKIILVIK